MEFMRQMSQTNNRLLDEFAKLFNETAGAAQGLKKEIDTVVKSQAQRILSDMDVVSRDEFEAVKVMAEKARQENERLAERLAALESKL